VWRNGCGEVGVCVTLLIYKYLEALLLIPDIKLAAKNAIIFVFFLYL